MSRTQYYKKFRATGLSFGKNNLSQEELENKTDLRINKCKKDSWKIFINLKKIKSSQRTKDILTPNNYPKNPNLIPVINNLSIIKNNKAPTFQQNQKEIMRFIKKKKMKRNNELNNLYNSMLINESKLFRNNLYVTQSEFKKFNSQSNSNKKDILSPSNKITRNIYNNNPKNDITGATSYDYFKNNFDNGGDSLINNETHYLIKSTRKKLPFPSIHKSKSIVDIKKKDKARLDNMMNKNMFKDLFRNNSDFSRIRMEINEAIFNELKYKDDMSKLGKKMIKFNMIRKIQNNKVKKFMSKEEYNTDLRYDKLIKLKEIIEKVYMSYAEKMNDYLEFLSNKSRQLMEVTTLYDKQIKEIDDDLEIIIVEIVKNQIRLEYLVKRRNFLLLIKQKFRNPPSYYDEILIRNSKILLVGDAIYDLKITKLIKDKNVMQFNISYLEVKEKIKQNNLNMDNILKKSTNEDEDEEGNKPLFSNVDEFIQLYKNLENKNLIYLKEEEISRKQINNLKEQYENETLVCKDIFMETEIKSKEKELEKLVKKNEILERTYNYYQQNIKKRSNNKKNIGYKNNNGYSKEKISSIEINNMKKYYEQLKKFKYDGLLLLHKLIELVKNLFLIKYNKNHYYSELFQDKKINEILNLNLKKYNSDKIQLINSYIINLISKYEIICKYILNKNHLYSLDEKNEKFIKEKKGELISLKKKQNSDDLIKIIKEKKKMEIKKIIEKSSKSIAYIPSKIFLGENNITRNKILKNIQQKIMNENKNNFLEYEFNSFVKYKDEY
jgi:hypothetical protein